MTCKPGSKHERAFMEAIRIEIAGGSTMFSRETVQELIDCYQREAARFDELALDVAFGIERDSDHIATMYEEFTKRMAGDDAEADTVAMRDQIDRYKALGTEHRDAR